MQLKKANKKGADLYQSFVQDNFFRICFNRNDDNEEYLINLRFCGAPPRLSDPEREVQPRGNSSGRKAARKRDRQNDRDDAEDRDNFDSRSDSRSQGLPVSPSPSGI